jgi:thiol-disulfide isomerase/thioredoxin
MPFESERTVAYVASQLDSDVPDSLFTFAPPPGAVLVGRFPDNWTTGSSLEGRALPKITFTTTDGKVLSTESLRGKPALLDIWASWCAPCVEELDA